ncbi:MAG: DEAD/DEAH box helicase [Chloroflexi bacterium]|nr:DEAD/DEAH box helicase [Chloroflexota bacterium]
MPATAKQSPASALGSGLRGWLQRQAARRIAPPEFLATLDPLDLTLETPTLTEVLDVGMSRPAMSGDLWLTRPEITSYDVTMPMPEQEVIGCSLAAVAVSENLAGGLSSGKVDGTLFFQARKEEEQNGRKRTVPVVTPSQRRETQSVSRERASAGPPGALLPNLFELLLPVLLPPAKTEFGQELLLPEELYPFQAYGVKWLVDHDAALLADDMGLGKTIQAIIAFRLLLQQAKGLQCLVVCPKSVVSSWRRHFADWAPDLQVVTIRGAKQTRDSHWAAYNGKAHVILANYEIVRNDADSAKTIPFAVVIVDEIQKIKNPGTETTQAIRRLNGVRRWGLSGTPLENRPEDVVSIFGFIKPGLFRGEELRVAHPVMVRQRIEPYMLRRRKADVLKELPPKVKDVRYVELEEVQRRSYDEAERTGRIELETGENVTVQHVLALITRLKQICNFDPSTADSVKLEWLKDHLETAVEEDSKVLVFSQFVQTLDKIEPQVSDYAPLKYTGQLSTGQRDQIEQAFQEDAKNKVMLVSLRAGGMGLTLTAANYVVHFDSWWNPAVMTQAEDRTHRIGQDKTVFVTTLVAEDTIEERIQRLLDRKRHLFDRVIDDLSDTGLQKVLSEEELFGLFGLKPRRVTRQDERSRVTPSQPGAAHVFRPEEPFSNVVRLREILRSCEDYIWWADPHFGARALEELAVVVDPSKIREIRILSRSDQFTERAKSDFQRLCQEMARKGIAVEWRTTDKSISHDRYIVGANQAYNVPPVNAIFQGAYGEGLRTTNRPPFEEWWELAQPAR